MKFIMYNDNYDINLIHNMPFDEEHGLHKTKEELLQIGALVENVPEVEVEKNKIVKYKYNKFDNSVYYELEDKPLTLVQENERAIKELSLQVTNNEDLIKKSLLSIQEIFNLISPILKSNDIDLENLKYINEIQNILNSYKM